MLARQGITMVDIPPGYFYMGSDGQGENFDEAPIHKVIISRPFRMSATEITNAQFEQFMPDHRDLRGKDGVSLADDEAVTNVSYHDAVAFCRWLSEKEGKHYRLPTEAEWEYACRAGTLSQFHTGDGLPAEYHRNQTVTRDYGNVDLTVGRTTPNPWGLYDMHGNVEEWCLDYYGPYADSLISDPMGPPDGEFRVTRGGSHGTPEKYLRSTNRMAMLPSDKHSQTGFRIVESDTPLSYSGHESIKPRFARGVPQLAYTWPEPTGVPVFNNPIPFVIPPRCGTGVPFYPHNHQPAIVWCDNGDLLAIWFSAQTENGREVAVLASRLRKGSDHWDEASLFYKVPDRNMTGSSLLNDLHGRLIHINGVEASGDWQNLAMIMRESFDNGATWSQARIIAPGHTRRHQVIQGPIITREGWLIQPCDAGPGSHDGTALHISRDNGFSWTDPWDGAPLPSFSEGSAGSTIAGIHAGIVQLSDGSLMALGRGNSIPDSLGRNRMPMSLSPDMGRTWIYHASEFPPIDGGQRLILRRLDEGPLLLVSFTDHPQRTPESQRGMPLICADGQTRICHGLFAALSYDDGRTWPVKRLISDGSTRLLYGGAWTGYFEADMTHAEPRGYLAASQSPDGIIHLLSSGLHYRFNLAWLEAAPCESSAENLGRQ